MAEFKRTAYSEKLRDPRWQKLRLEVMQRDNWACQVCFDTESTLNVHHRWYGKGQEPWEASLEQLVTLCEECHGDERENRPDAEQELLHELRRRFLSGEVTSLAIAFHYMPKHIGVPDEVFITALSRYLSKPENCDVIVKWYFDHLKRTKDEQST